MKGSALQKLAAAQRPDRFPKPAWFPKPACSRWPAWSPRLIAAVYLLLALGAGVLNPLFEAPDEHWHYFTAQAIAQTGRLPRVEQPPDPWLGQEAAQPPLYYALAALLIAPLDTAAARETVWPNPHVLMGDASAVTNLNAFVHGPWEAWPWRGYALAAHLLRLFSSLLGLGTLLCISGAARCLWPARPQRAVLAMAMVAFLPQFVFTHSAVSNDALITFLSAAAIWQLLSLWRSGWQKRSLLLLGATIGLAILSKTAGLLLLAFALGVLLLHARQRRAPMLRSALQLAAFVALPALLFSGWLLLRNWALYGDITAANQFVALAGGDRAYSLSQVLAESSGLWSSFFAMFGWFNVRAPGWVYCLWNGLVLLALAGAARRLWPARRAPAASPPDRERLLIAAWLALWLVLVYAGLAAFMLRTPAAQGRLLFPALAPLALGLAYGLDAWPRARALWPLLALAAAIVSLFFVIPSRYALPQTAAAGALPAGATEHRVELGQGLTLLGYQIASPHLQPGHVLQATLYWQATGAPTPRHEAPQLVLELFGREQALVGKFQGYHGRGLYPASLWPRDAIVVEQALVPLARTMRAPTELRIQAGLAASAQRETIATVEVEPAQWPQAPGAPLAQLAAGIDLLQATAAPQRIRAGEAITVSLGWQARQDVPASFTTFVHLGPPGEPPLGQADGLPLGGYYPTSRWQAGEVILSDEYVLRTTPALAPGRYPLTVGLYDAQSGQRLALTVDGERQAHDAYMLGWIEVVPVE